MNANTQKTLIAKLYVANITSVKILICYKDKASIEHASLFGLMIQKTNILVNKQPSLHYTSHKKPYEANLQPMQKPIIYNENLQL